MSMFYVVPITQSWEDRFVVREFEDEESLKKFLLHAEPTSKFKIIHGTEYKYKKVTSIALERIERDEQD